MYAALEIASLLIVGLVAGAELGSWCCVQPVVARLPYEQYVAAEQAMLRTFGRIMPILMSTSGLLTVVLTVISRNDARMVFWLRIVVFVCIAVTIVTTLAVNVPINNRTATWRMTNETAEWYRLRAHWHIFQGIRGGLFALAFALLGISIVLGRR